MKSARASAAGLIALAIAAGSCVDATGPAALNAPTNVTVTLISPHSARISWAAPSAPEVYYIETYFIYRDGVKIGESSTTTFVDNGLSEGTTYKYRVAAFGVGLTSDQSVDDAASAITVPDVTAPTVTSSSPSHGSTNVPLASTITATFSEPMDAITVNATNFILKTSGGTAIPALVTYNATTRTALLTPSTALPSASPLTATITTGIKDVAGNRLASDFSFSFTTRDEIPPTVVSISPSNGSTGLATNVPLTITFSEAMDVASVTASIALKVTSSGVTVPGSVSYNPSTLTATFTPAASLAFATSYTLTVSPVAKDASGNALTASTSSTFSTAGAPDTTPPTVVTVSPTNGAASVSVNSTVVISFSEPMDGTSMTSLTVLLKSGSVTVPSVVSYSGATNSVTITPTAPLAFGADYSVTVTTGAKDLAGNGLASQFSSAFTTASAPDTTPPNVEAITPANGTNNVSVNTVITVKFSEPMNSATVTGSVALVIASNSSPVAANVSYDAATNTATLIPSAPLSFATAYTITVSTGAKDLSGNSLPSTITSGFSTASAPDVIAPNVVSVTPANLAAGINVSTNITIEFSEAMNSSSINASTVVLTLTGTSSTVAGTVSYNPATRTATFTPSSALAFSTSHTITVSGVTDLSGNGLASPFSSVFATGPAPDLTPPTVASTNPPNFATGVSPTVTPTVTFSEPMKSSTLNGSTITLTSSGSPIAGIVSYDPVSRTATFTPSSPLSFSTSYTLTVTTGVQDIAGNQLASQFTSSFTVMPNPDTTRPTILTTSAGGRAALPLENPSAITVTFSEPMNAGTITTSSIKLKSNQTGNAVPGTVTYNSATNTATFTPSSPLGYQESGQGSYTITVTTAVADLAGNTLASNFDLEFVRLPYFQGTSSDLDVSKPQIHIHVTFSQSGTAITLSSECQRLPGADCDLLPRNQPGVDAVGPLDDTAGGTIGIAATITELSGTLNGTNIAFTFKVANGRTFAFTGTMTDEDTMTGTLSGATLTTSVPITLSRF
ncbi:MAG TPA: Ig-like domain-containing protein [Gemmatimonadaceae bacterium]|nr:Ig-like domain-containing protein [Gemmatimonadaceae bacterium]